MCVATTSFFVVHGGLAGRRLRGRGLPPYPHHCHPHNPVAPVNIYFWANGGYDGFSLIYYLYHSCMPSTNDEYKLTLALIYCPIITGQKTRIPALRFMGRTSRFLGAQNAHETQFPLFLFSLSRTQKGLNRIGKN